MFNSVVDFSMQALDSFFNTEFDLFLNCRLRSDVFIFLSAVNEFNACTWIEVSLEGYSRTLVRDSRLYPQAETPIVASSLRFIAPQLKPDTSNLHSRLRALLPRYSDPDEVESRPRGCHINYGSNILEYFMMTFMSVRLLLKYTKF